MQLESHCVFKGLFGSGGSPMADRPGKGHRKEALDLWKAKQRASARAKLPLPDAQMLALFNMLDEELPRHGCDRTLRLVFRWLSGQGLVAEPVEVWLHENGGHCDCEALANSEQASRGAIHDVNW
jgi:hypothetical protein